MGADRDITSIKNRMCLVQDEDTHWYCIPVDEREMFYLRSEVAWRDDDFSAFEDAYGKYRINGPQTLTFVDPKE